MKHRTIAVLVATLAAATFAQGPSESTFSVTGRVVDSAGNAVTGAVVLADNGGSYQVIEAWSETPWREWVPDPIAAASAGPFTRRASAPSSADGRFRVDGVPLPAGEGWITVVHEAFATARMSARGGVRSGVVDVGDVVVRPGAALKAIVRTEVGAPAADAWVVVRSPMTATQAASPSSWAGGEEPGDVRVGRTGADGTCVIRGLAEGPVRLAAFTRSHVPTEVAASAEHDVTREAAITLARGASVRVEAVTRGTGAPVAGARVTVDRPEAGTSWPGPAPLARAATDASGVAAIEGIELLDAYRVTVVPPDFAVATIIHPGGFCVIATAKSAETVRVALAPARQLVVRVLDAGTREPITGASVQARPDWKRFDHSGGQGTDLELAWDAASASYASAHARPGPWIVTPWAQGYVPGAPVTVEVADSAAPSLGEALLVRADATAAGRVVEQASGAPVAGARIQVYEWVELLSDGNRLDVESAADGTFALAGLLGAGFPLRVEITAPGYVPRIVTWPAEGRLDQLGDVGLQRAGVIRGRMTAAMGGQPLAGVRVWLHDAAAPRRGKGDGRCVVTDDAGSFAFVDLPPGRYILNGQRESAGIALTEGARVTRDLVR